MVKTIKVTNKQQLECLVSLVAKNPDLGRCKGHKGSTHVDVRGTWKQFSIQLNSLGPPYRTGPEWQRVWIHYKANLKRKLIKKKEENGFGPLKDLNLSPIEEKVFEIANLSVSLKPTGHEFYVDVSGAIQNEDNLSSELPAAVSIKDELVKEGFVEEISIKEESNQEDFETVELAQEEYVQDEFVEETASSSKHIRPQEGDDKMTLLAKQVETQYEMLRTLKKIEETKHLEYILKKQKFALLQKSEERKSFLRELKIRIAQTKLKRKLKKS